MGGLAGQAVHAVAALGLLRMDSCLQAVDARHSGRHRLVRRLRDSALGLTGVHLNSGRQMGNPRRKTARRSTKTVLRAPSPELRTPSSGQIVAVGLDVVGRREDAICR